MRRVVRSLWLLLNGQSKIVHRFREGLEVQEKLIHGERKNMVFLTSCDYPVFCKLTQRGLISGCSILAGGLGQHGHDFLQVNRFRVKIRIRQSKNVIVYYEQELLQSPSLSIKTKCKNVVQFIVKLSGNMQFNYNPNKTLQIPLSLCKIANLEPRPEGDLVVVIMGLARAEAAERVLSPSSSL